MFTPFSVIAAGLITIFFGMRVLIAFRGGLVRWVEPSLIVWGAFFALYVLPVLTAAEELSLLFSKESYETFLILSIGCGIAFEFGSLFSRTKINKPTGALIIRPARFEAFAVVVGVVGLLAYGYFVYASGGIEKYYRGHGLGAYAQVSGYIYEMRYFIFSSILMLLVLRNEKKLAPPSAVFLVAALCFLVFDAWFTNQRGSWVRLGIIFLLSSKALHVQNVNLFRKSFRAILIIFVVAILVLLAPFMRGSTAIGVVPFEAQLERVTSALTSTEILRNLAAGSTLDEGNELAYAVEAVRARDTLDVYDYGEKWLFPFFNFVPRGLWPEKPMWNDYSISIEQTMRMAGTWIPAQGAAETSVADAYYRFSWATLLFWAILGAGMGKAFRSVTQVRPQVLFYACLLVGFVYFLTQNFVPFVSFSLFMWLPIWAGLVFQRISFFPRVRRQPKWVSGF